MTPSRAAAFGTLRLVERGGFASDLLREASRGLEARDAALAEQIAMGAIRVQSQLDFLIQHYGGRAADKLDAEVRIALRMGIYQLRYLERVPAHAAVAESVEAVKRARKRSAAGFVNAVLRKVDRTPVEWPDPAVELAHPAWILERWERRYGGETAQAIALAGLAPPEKFIRVPAGGSPPAGAEPCAEVAGCYRFDGAGAFRRQDIGSQSIVPLLGLEASQSFLDVCAAPGNKTAQALEAGVRVIACDVNFKRLGALRDLAAERVTADGTRDLPFRRKFDRILVDAPCSGTGTLARNPEIKWRLRPADLTDLQSRQKRLLARAAEALAPGGRLVYSTCSLEGEENDEVVAGYPVRHILRRIPGRDRGDGFFAAVIQW